MPLCGIGFSLSCPCSQPRARENHPYSEPAVGMLESGRVESTSLVGFDQAPIVLNDSLLLRVPTDRLRRNCQTRSTCRDIGQAKSFSARHVAHASGVRKETACSKVDRLLQSRPLAPQADPDPLAEQAVSFEQADLPVRDRPCVVGRRRRLWRVLPTQSHAGGVRHMTAKAVPNRIGTGSSLSSRV
jgi:hypothetical protein